MFTVFKDISSIFFLLDDPYGFYLSCNIAYKKNIDLELYKLLFIYTLV